MNKMKLLYGPASVEGNGSIHDEECTIGHGLTMEIAKGLSIHERTCYACIAHLGKKLLNRKKDTVHL